MENCYASFEPKVTILCMKSQHNPKCNSRTVCKNIFMYENYVSSVFYRNTFSFTQSKNKNIQRVMRTTLENKRKKNLKFIYLKSIFLM